MQHLQLTNNKGVVKRWGTLLEWCQSPQCHVLCILLLGFLILRGILFFSLVPSRCVYRSLNHFPKQLRLCSCNGCTMRQLGCLALMPINLEGIHHFDKTLFFFAFYFSFSIFLIDSTQAQLVLLSTSCHSSLAPDVGLALQLLSQATTSSLVVDLHVASSPFNALFPFPTYI